MSNPAPLHWTDPQVDAHEVAVEFCCAQIPGPGNKSVTIGSIERKHLAAGWDEGNHWRWKPWCDFGRYLLEEGAEGTQGDLQGKVLEIWNRLMKGAE